MSINSKFFSLDYLEDFSRRLEQIAMWERLKLYICDTGFQTVSPASTLEYLLISGPGKLLFNRFDGRDVSCWNLKHNANLDEAGWYTAWNLVPSAEFAAASGATSIGYFSGGTTAYIVCAWDTTNHIYNIWCPLPFTPWLESARFRFYNTNSSNSARMLSILGYYLPTASKSFKLEMVAPKMPKIENLNEIRNEFKLHHIVMALSKQGKGKGAKNQYKLTINAPDSFRDKNLYKVVEKIQKATK